MKTSLRPGPGTSLTLSKPAVLCVDDEPAILAALRRSLRKGGYEVLTSESPAEALELVCDPSIRLVISDQLMPQMSGVELLQEVRRRSPATAVLLLTGYPEGMPGAAGVAAGVRWVVSKPWDDEALHGIVEGLLSPEADDDPPTPDRDFDLGGGD